MKVILDSRSGHGAHTGISHIDHILSQNLEENFGLCSYYAAFAGGNKTCWKSIELNSK